MLLALCPLLCRPCLPPPLSVALTVDSDVARAYELEVDSQYVQLRIYTQEVDYQDITVQVRSVRGGLIPFLLCGSGWFHLS